MKVVYLKSTDTMYVVLREDRRYVESEEVSPGVVLDFDGEGNLIGIEVYDKASEKFDLSVLAAEGLPVEVRASLTEGAGAQGREVRESEAGSRARP
jgi:uncharacterized protein YuzE